MENEIKQILSPELLASIEMKGVFIKVSKSLDFAGKNQEARKLVIKQGAGLLADVYKMFIDEVEPDNEFEVDEFFMETMKRFKEEREETHKQNFDNDIHHHDRFGKGLIVFAGVVIFSIVVYLILKVLTQ